MRALEPEVVDAVWSAVEALLPTPDDEHPLGCHRPRVSNQLCFRGILIRLVTGASWVDIEAILDFAVSDTTLRARRDEWIAAGVFDKLVAEALAAFDRIISLDLGDVALDGSSREPALRTARTPVGARYSPKTSRSVPAHSPVVPPACASSIVAAMTLVPDSAACRRPSIARRTASLSRLDRHACTSSTSWACTPGSTWRTESSPRSGDSSVSTKSLSPTTTSSPDSIRGRRSVCDRTNRVFSSWIDSNAPPCPTPGPHRARRSHPRGSTRSPGLAWLPPLGGGTSTR